MDKLEDMVRVHLRIEGRVQGVFFRASTLDQAIRLGLKGWVRNCPDGSVEVYVRHVQLEWEEPQDEFQDFRTTR